MTASKLEAEVWSDMSGSRVELRRLRADPQITTVIIEHRGRLGWMNT